MDEYRALGLNSRGVAMIIAAVGLLFSPVIIGIPLLIWGAVADHMLAKHDKEMKKRYRPGKNWKGPVPAMRGTSLDYQAPETATQDVDSLIEAGLAEEAEKCENCGREIGKLETPQLWQEHIVCPTCAKALAQSAK